MTAVRRFSAAKRRVLLVGAVLLFATTNVTVIAQEGTGSDDRKNKRIAIIGGGIAGTFTARYLAEYDAKSSCSLDSITIFDPSPISVDKGKNLGVGTSSAVETDDPNWQGGRVASLTLPDGTVVEIGASIFFSGNKLIMDLIESDSRLIRTSPFSAGKVKDEQEKGKPMPTGFGVYDGEGRWPLLFSNLSSLLRKAKLLYRYNIDLLRLNSATDRALQSFNLIYSLLDSDHPETFFRSPDEMWDAVGLLKPLRLSFDEFLDDIGVSREVQWWRTMMPFQGSLRKELVTAASICNYNQGPSRLNGLVGLATFLTTKGELFSILDGNQQLVLSAFEQARLIYKSRCHDADKSSTIQHIQEKVTTVVADLNHMELFSSQESLGEFDIVVLAAPLQQSQISFLIRSHMDKAVLLPMPLNGLVAVDEADTTEEGRRMTPLPLPSSASRCYTQVVTTIVSNATLQSAHFNVSKESLPRSVFVTERERELEGISSMTQITSDGVYKVFSSERLPRAKLDALFGPYHKVEYVKVWGGQHGGAVPDYSAGGEASISTSYLLYDGGLGTKGQGEGPALFYANSIEASIACVEMSAVGAKSVAKLVGKRLQLITPQSPVEDREL